MRNRILELIAAAVLAGAPAAAQEFVNASGSAEDDAIRIYREGRDCIDAQDWACAELRFGEYLKRGQRRYGEAALYYLAFALKKQQRAAEADQRLQQLLRDYPSSSWAEDARAMRLELAARLGNRRLIEGALKSQAEQVRAAALQTMLESDPDRAVGQILEILDPKSGASDSLREICLLMLWGRSVPEAVPGLSEVARTAASDRVRLLAVNTLAANRSSQSLEMLLDLAVGEDRELASAAVRSLRSFPEAQSPAFLGRIIEDARSQGGQRAAIFELADRLGTEQAYAELMRIFRTSRDNSLRKAIVTAFGIAAARNRPRAQQTLIEVRDTAEREDLRQAARHFAADAPSDEAMDALLRWYSLEQDDEIKLTLIVMLGGYKDREPARAKLQEIIDSSRNPALVKQASGTLKAGGIRTTFPYLQRDTRRTAR